MNLKEKTVQCRKPHRCEWCGEKIESGDFAKYRVTIWEGEFMTDYMHPECFDALCNSSDLDEGFDSYAQERGKTYEESQ
jgi:hypothetical protein